MQQNQGLQPIEILQKYWGYPGFRSVQEQVIDSIMAGRDTLALLPTGGGKSICFQVPALAQDGLCLVISPLIALMKDQVEQLRKRGISALAIHSGMPYAELDRLLDNCAYGDVKLLYLSPERLHTPLFRERLSKMTISFVAVDEAHCISQWGYDFRPAYLQIAEIREALPRVPIIALTATATPEVCQDIQDKLHFNNGQVFQQSFTRENLAYVVRPTEAKPEELINILRKVNGSAILYVRNRRLTKELALLLQQKGIKADYYHAGLPMEERSRKQQAWITDQVRVIVSTNAFGMGIDKPNVRLVIHWELPDSLEGYFQEAGRAGRDGNKAYAVLLYHPSDAQKLQRQFELSYPDLKEVRRVYRALGSYYQLAVGAGFGESFDFDLLEFSSTYQFEPMVAFNCLQLLEKEGWIILSEAVYNPATLKVMVNQDQLYDFMLKHPKLDKILKIILRSYQGAFHHHINIREQSVANFLKIAREELQKALLLLQKEQIIDYHPQKEKPQLFFVNGRMDAITIAFDHTGYHFRKEQQQKRMQQAIAYAEAEACRPQKLLAYFGETNAEPCGQCDYCLDLKKKHQLLPQDYERYRKKLQLVLGPDTLSLEEILAAFAAAKKERVLKALEYLLEEGQIRQINELFEWQK